MTPALDCDGSSLSQISWYFNLKGSVIDGQFVPIGMSICMHGVMIFRDLYGFYSDAPETGSCASSGLKYPLKSGSPTTSVSFISLSFWSKF